MPLGSRLVQARGSVVTTTRVSDQTTGAESSRDESRPTAAVTFDQPHAVVSVEHSTTMSANFQTVVSRCAVQLPVQATDSAICAGFNRSWALVEQELARRAGWAQEVLETLGEARKASERK